MSAQPAPSLRVVDTDTGEIRNAQIAPCPRCQDVGAGDLEEAERELRKARRRIKSLEADRAAAREADPQRNVVLALIEHWKVRTRHPRANTFAADRFDLVKARLNEGYTPADIELAIEGLAAYPYVGPEGRMAAGKPAQRHDRLGIALAGGEALERFCNLGHRARKERG